MRPNTDPAAERELQRSQDALDNVRQGYGGPSPPPEPGPQRPERELPAREGPDENDSEDAPDDEGDVE